MEPLYFRSSNRRIASLEVRRRAQKSKIIKRRKIVPSKLGNLDSGETEILYSTDPDLSIIEDVPLDSEQSEELEIPSDSKTSSKESSHVSIDKLLPEIRKAIKPTGEYLYGTNAVLSALKANKRPFFHRLFLSPISHDKTIDQNTNGNQSKRARNFDEITALCDTLDIPIEFCSRQELNHFVSKNMHQGVVLDCDPLIISKLDEYPLGNEQTEQSIWIAFDHLYNEENVGAALRSALFFGVSGCILPQKRKAPLSPLVATTSSGALDGIDIRMCVQPMDEYLGMMRESKWTIVGLDIGDKEETHGNGPSVVELPKFVGKRKEKMIIVIGNESRGLGEMVRAQCTELVYIAGNTDGLQYNVDSLNVASAVSVALYQIMVNMNR